MTKQQPINEIKLGRIRAAIWANGSETGTRHNVTFSRLYKDADENWKDSFSFGRDDLLLVAKLADLAHSWIFAQGGERQTEKEEAGEVEETKPRRPTLSTVARKR